MPRIIEYEGRRIEVPDDADDGFVADVLAAQPAAASSATPTAAMPPAPAPLPGAPAAPAAAAPAEDRGWLDAIMGLADQGARGVAQGVTNLAGLPQGVAEIQRNVGKWGLEKLGAPQGVIDAVDYITPLADYAPSAKGMQGALDSANNATADAIGVERPRGEPEGRSERVVNRVGQELGAMLVPGGAAVATAERIGVEGARRLPGLARMFVEPAAVNAAKFMGKEATIATGAGLGASTANEIAGNYGKGVNPWIDAGGALAGAVGTGVGTSLVSSVSDIGRALFGNGSYADEVVKDAVMRKIATSAGIPAAPGVEPDLTALINQVEEGARVSDAIPGFTESLADRTKNPGLAALEYSRQGGPNAGSYTQQRANNTAAVDNALAEAAPDPNATPGQFSSELALERDRRLTDAGVQTANAQDAYTRATAGLQPLMTGEGRGANIRTALEDASEGARQILSEAWRPINESAQQVDVAPLNRRFGAVTEEQPLANQRYVPNEAAIPGQLIDPGTPPQPTGILGPDGNPIMRPGQAANSQAPLNEITALRSTLTDELRNPATTPKERRVIEQYVEQLDGYMANSLPEDLRQQYAAARAATVDFNDRFTRPQTAVAQTLDQREGQPRYPDSSVAGRFVQTDQGRIADFEALMREAGTDTRVQSAVRDQVLSDVRERGLLENPQGLQDYLGQYGQVFNRFPQLREELGTAGNLRRQLTEAQTGEQGLRDTLTRQGRSSVANYLSYGDEKAQQAMKGVLASRDPKVAADELLTFVGDDKRAVEGARKVFWDILQEKSRAGGRTTANIDGSQPWSPRALNDFLDNPANAAVAERLWRDNPEHLQQVRDIAKAIQGVDTRNAAKAPNTSGTPQGSFEQLLSPETLQSRFYAYRSGKISGSFLITALVSTLVRKGVRKAQEEGFQRMLDDVVLDADTAALLMRENNPADRAALSKKAKLWFGNEANSIVNGMSADDEDDTTGRVMDGGR
jgi:hypothetical protein